jgi:hypothetical protein
MGDGSLRQSCKQSATLYCRSNPWISGVFQVGSRNSKGVLMPVPRQYFEEPLQPVRLDTPVGRQLKQDRAQPGFESFHARQIVRERCLRVAQTLEVSNETATLRGKTKVRRRLLPPAFDGGFRGQPVKTIVDFHGLEMPDIPGQVLGRRKTSRVEVTIPMPVVPSRCADSQTRSNRFPQRATGSRDAVPKLNP